MDVNAALTHRFGEPLAIETLQLARLGERDVLIQNKAAGLCHSDLFCINGGTAMGLPLLPGHEGAGIVVDCGSGVSRLRPGDRVVTCGIGECGHCPQCRSRRTNLCETAGLPGMALSFAPSQHFTFKGAPVFALAPGATFADHTVVNEAFATKLPDGIPFDVACLFGCAVMTGVGCVLFTAQVETESTVVVFGLGGVGLNVVDGAQLAGSRMIIGVDANPAKESIARAFGLTHFINPRECDDVVGRIQELTGGGADYAFECVGNIKLGLMAIESTRPEWGSVVQIGACPPGEDKLPVAVMDLLPGRKVQGSFFGKAKNRTDMSKMFDWFLEGKLHTDMLISHRIHLEGINEGFAMMDRSESIRTVVEY